MEMRESGERNVEQMTRREWEEKQDTGDTERERQNSHSLCLVS